MNANAFEKGKKAFQFLLIILFRLTTITCQLNLFNTNQTITSNSLQYHCLNYHIYREKPAYQELRDVIDEVIPYCFRPENNFDETVKTSINPLSQKLSFKELFLANITAQQLLLWSAPIEAAERYQFYLNQGNSSTIVLNHGLVLNANIHLSSIKECLLIKLFTLHFMKEESTQSHLI